MTAPRGRCLATLATLATLACTLLLACENDRNPLGLLEPQFAGGGVAHLPFGGGCRTEFTFTGPTTLLIGSVCQLRGVGRVTGLAHQSLTFTSQGILIENTTTYTTPSGDEIYASFSGVGIPDQTQTKVALSGVETYAGGTGRFAAIAGSAQLTGQADLVTSTGRFETSGQVTF